ncbi:hypothetical protein [Methylibium rhizosphaerae]|uniref:hypothetical protein n=1 Tax=Methylibium rhizosphaerae TaxID=2570323 RepID=UPI00112BE183|nr:hypothetical protein [Methylibium rhizosphaerae]
MSLRTTISLLALAALPLAAEAATYEITVTRKASNVYRVDGKSITIQTRYCYVYAYSEEALLKSSGYGGELIFIDSRDKCDVKAIYGKSEPSPGKYAVRVTHESDDWYEVQGTGSYLQTSACLSLALGQEAFLSLQAGGFGRIVFDDGQSCVVEGVYTRMKLE